jgi:hypothetical protein
MCATVHFNQGSENDAPRERSVGHRGGERIQTEICVSIGGVHVKVGAFQWYDLVVTGSAISELQDLGKGEAVGKPRVQTMQVESMCLLHGIATLGTHTHTHTQSGIQNVAGRERDALRVLDEYGQGQR